MVSLFPANVLRLRVGFCPQVEFAANVFQLVTTFNSLSLTDTEVGLFAAIVLLTPDRPGVSDVKTVQHSQDRIVEAFKLQVSRTREYAGSGRRRNRERITADDETNSDGRRDCRVLGGNTFPAKRSLTDRGCPWCSSARSLASRFREVSRP